MYALGGCFSLFHLIGFSLSLSNSLLHSAKWVEILNLEDTFDNLKLIQTLYTSLNETITRLKCPDGWQRVGSSCYSSSQIPAEWSSTDTLCRKEASAVKNIPDVLARVSLATVNNPMELHAIAKVILSNNLSHAQVKLSDNLLSSMILLEKRIDDLFFASLRTRSFMKSFYCSSVQVQITAKNSSCCLLKLSRTSDQQIKCILEIINCSSSIPYPFVCEYVSNLCLHNFICGSHGRCIDGLKGGLKCECNFLYGGKLCDKGICVTKEGIQIIVCVFLILFVTCANSWLIKRCCLKIVVLPLEMFGIIPKKREKKRPLERRSSLRQNVIFNRRRICSKTVSNIVNNSVSCTATRTKNVGSPSVRRSVVVGLVTLAITATLLIVTSLTQMLVFRSDFSDDKDLQIKLNRSVRIVKQCQVLTNFVNENLLSFPFALLAILIFSFFIKREKYFRRFCDGRPGLPIPLEPFRTKNRFTTAVIFGILACEVLKIFEELLFKTNSRVPLGILLELSVRIGFVFLIGMRYYPVLASLHFDNVVCRCVGCIYAWCDLIYVVLKEGFCMGFIPISNTLGLLEEAKLRLELGSWYVVYGLVRNAPHFTCLACVTAELTVRFISKLQEKTSLSSLYCENETEDGASHRIYVRNLFRHKSIDTEHGGIFDKIYKWRDDFRFSTISLCTFVTAYVFLYYLTCTLVFFHLSRSEGHGFVLNFYFNHILNIRLSSAISFWREILFSGVIAFALFAFQMFHGMKKYRYNKLMLFKGIFEDVPSARNLDPSKLISQSVHYSGFLIGYMAWGFIIVFYLLLLVFSTISTIFRQRVAYIESMFTFLIPVFMIYVLKILLVRSTSKIVFTQGLGSKMALNNRRIHAVFIYFNFFFDCFLGIVACFARLLKSMLLNVFFMARLDYSFVGRPLERLDPGFSTYVAFLHTEVAHTHPVMVTFCELLWDDIKVKRLYNTKSEKSVVSKRARFRWFLIYTLMRNCGLLSFRKNLTIRLQTIVENHVGPGDSLKSQHSGAPVIRVYSTNCIKDCETVPLIFDSSVTYSTIIDNPLFFRKASYSERDALWRQSVREQVNLKHRYRYCYGCLNHFPAINILDFNYYRRLSSVKAESSLLDSEIIDLPTLSADPAPPCPPSGYKSRSARSDSPIKTFYPKVPSSSRSTPALTLFRKESVQLETVDEEKSSGNKPLKFTSV